MPRALMLGLVLGIVVVGGCRREETARTDTARTDTARGAVSKSDLPPALVEFDFDLTAQADPGKMEYTPGNVRVPQQLKGRTLLEGDISSIDRPADIIGRVLDVRGVLSDGLCTRASIHITEIPPGSVLKPDTWVSKAVAQTHLSGLIEKQKSREVGYLAFALEMSETDRAEVVIEDVADVTIKGEWNSAVDSVRLRMKEQPVLASGTCGRYVVTRVVATNVKHRLLHNKKSGLTGAIQAAFRIGGQNYFTDSRLSNDLRVAMTLQPINYGVVVSNDTTAKKSPAPPYTATLDDR